MDEAKRRKTESRAWWDSLTPEQQAAEREEHRRRVEKYREVQYTVADRLRFEANSDGGIVAEIEDTLADRSDDENCTTANTRIPAR